VGVELACEKSDNTALSHFRGHNTQGTAFSLVLWFSVCAYILWTCHSPLWP